MAFTVTANVHIGRDKQNVIRLLRHLQQPYTAKEGRLEPGEPLTPHLLASKYVMDVAELYNIDKSQLADLEKRPDETLTVAGTELRFYHQKSIKETTVVSYVQTHLGLPIWQAGVSVTMHDKYLRITSSHSTIHSDIKISMPSRSIGEKLEQLSPEDVMQLLGIKAAHALLTINGKRLLVYQYDPDQRYGPEASQKRKQDRPEDPPPELLLPPVSEELKPNRHYVVAEVLFTYSTQHRKNLNWRAFVELDTGSVLYLRAFTSGVVGNVFLLDPVTATGDTSITGCSPAAVLDPLVTSVTLPGLTPPANPGDPQALHGEFVALEELDDPAIDPPVTTTDFHYSPVTQADDFAAVNAYYHVDALFRLMQDMGFDIASYFNGTSFPVPVDHRGWQGESDANCDGNARGDGVGKFAFGLADASCTLGIAALSRVVMHEFGHALLYDSIHSAFFDFAHSPGDSLAAILCDPGSQAPDRFKTFYMVSNPLVVDRRHDRSVAEGWAWGGSQDLGSFEYNAEQILSTTLFRAYLSAGGDAAHPNASIQLARRQSAARFMTYLIIRAIGILGTYPVTPPMLADDFATALMDADTGTALFDGQPGGTFHKVIRWAFEKQGLYSRAYPVVDVGPPPDVDVYINDGRDGEYQYQRNYWSTTDIWNRLTPSGGTAHETPVLGISNYMFVRVRNRGLQQANNVTVYAYHCRPGTGLVWPNGWKPMRTASRPAPPIPFRGETIVGPFEWVPETEGHECLLAVVSADGDLSNADPSSGLPCAAGPTADWRLIPFDNNIAQRNVAPVPGGGGSGNLDKALKNRRFWVANPTDRTVRVVLEPHLPEFLLKREWQLRFLNAGGSSFTLGPRTECEVMLELVPGSDFLPSDMEVHNGKNDIEIFTLIDDQLAGGMTYRVDPKMSRPGKEHPDDDEAMCTKIAKKLLNCMRVLVDWVKSAFLNRP